ncbi:MAG TPA: thioredoxin domain-containing protein [Polyangiales bacterium]
MLQRTPIACLPVLSALLLALTLTLCAAGCASSAAKPASTTPPSAAASAAGPGLGGANANCQRFVSELCQALGAETEPCMSLRNVGEWLPAKACDAASAELPTALARVQELRKDCNTLTQKLCADLGSESSSCREITRDIPQVPAGSCRTLLSHYPELVAQMRTREEHNKPMSAEQWSSLLQGGPPSVGPQDAKVTVVEFSDFQCPYCAQASNTVKQIRQTYGDKVRVVFRQYPLAFHENAHAAAVAALAAHAQGKFWPLHDMLFEHQGALDRASLEGYAKQLGLDVPAFKKALDSGSYDAQIDADLALGRTVHVDGTPTMFVNAHRVDNPTEFSEVSPLIDAALAGK